MKSKVKRYQDGGITINQQPAQQPKPLEMPGFANTSTMSSYPFQSSGSTPSSTDSGVNQTFNIQPSAQAGQPQGMKRGGKVSVASKRADGCAIRGKTRA
jgi:hypothetical protein